MPDVIDTIAGIEPGSALDALRARRPVTRTHSELSYCALFAPEDPRDVSLAERFAIGAYVAGLHGLPAAVAHYAAPLDPALAALVAAAVAETRHEGPTGHYPAGPLSAEDTPGPVFTLRAATATALGPRLAVAFAHAHALVFHPRDARPAWLAALTAAGFSADGIVTLSQIVSFLAYQLRAASGLAVLAAAR